MKLNYIGIALLLCSLVLGACNLRAQHNNSTQEQNVFSQDTDVKEQPSSTSGQKTDTITSYSDEEQPHTHYREISHPTPNFDPSRTNEVKGVILHHTAEPTIERSLWVLTESKKGVGTHCVIDTDGTRYIMCDPTVVTYHAGYSRLDGREGCNGFTIGIEFQGNTLEHPLTQDQISSAIEILKTHHSSLQHPPHPHRHPRDGTKKLHAPPSRETHSRKSRYYTDGISSLHEATLSRLWEIILNR